MPVLELNLSRLPPAQLRLWPELGATPQWFTRYGGTALALRLGHRTSVDFDFFSNTPFNPERLASTLPYLKDAERVQMAPDTLTCRVDRAGAVLVSFFGGLGLGQNPMITLKALSFFDDVPMLSGAVRERLRAAVEAVDVTNLPELTAYAPRGKMS